MAYVNVPKDLTRVKNKIAFNMTKRQLICLGIAIIMGIPFYFLTRNVLGTSNAATGMVFLMLPAFLFAWYEKDGMHLEQILRNIIRVRFLRPAIRTYETVNRYAKKEDVEKKGETIVEKTQNQKRKRVKGKRIAKKKDENCVLRRLDYQQEEGLMSSLPLGINHIPIERALTTTSTAIFVPFTTQELFMGGESLYYGLNAMSNNMIMVDRKRLKNPNGLILGTPGSGKSFAAKREITNAFFATKDDIIISDPEGEYYPLVQALGGQVIHISATSKDYVNPMDINMDYSDDDEPLGVKSEFILSLCELVMGSKNGIEPEEKSVIDRCLPLVYQKYFLDPIPLNMPVLGDLYQCLRKQNEPKAQRIATALEIYVNGSLKVFNHRTNVELDNRIICFDIKDLGKQLKKLGMLIIQDQVWNRVTIKNNTT